MIQLIILIGVASVIYGLALIYPPLAWMLGGSLLVFVAVRGREPKAASRPPTLLEIKTEPAPDHLRRDPTPAPPPSRWGARRRPRTTRVKEE